MGNDFLISIGKRILERRKSFRLSQEGLAEKASTSKQTVSRAERGERELGVQIASRLAEALEMSMDYLVNGVRNETDLLILDKKVANLPEHQLRLVEEICRYNADVREEGSI